MWPDHLIPLLLTQLKNDTNEPTCYASARKIVLWFEIWPGNWFPSSMNVIGCKWVTGWVDGCVKRLRQAARIWFFQFSNFWVQHGSITSSCDDHSLFIYLLEVCHTKLSVHLSQQKYVQDLLKQTRMANYKAINSLCSTSFKLSKKYEQLLDDVAQYRRVVGALQ